MLQAITLDRLKASALQSCEWRGHAMGEWSSEGLRSTEAECKCVKCGMYVGVDTKPPPNGIDIAGEAVALNCGDKR